MGLTHREVSKLAPYAQKVIAEQMAAQGITDFGDSGEKRGQKGRIGDKLWQLFGPNEATDAEIATYREVLKHLDWSLKELCSTPGAPKAAILSLTASIETIMDRVVKMP